MNRKGFANIVVVIIALVLLAGAGAGYLVVKKQKTETSPVSPESGEVTVPFVGSVADETADGSASLPQGWKTYRNEKYGFEIKYPPIWVATEGYFPNVSFTPLTSLNIFQNSQQVSLTQWVQQERGGLVSQMRPVTINGITALRGKESGMVGYDAVYFGKGTLVVGILSQESSQDTPIFETMLATFKFTG
ncbi:MAG TPA: hypothetical protein VNK70_03380 [Candidatus Paceibacterota bacterium]|nr:hypothetical protein [Candidatus Paceibacterota bacterium]